MGSVSAPHCLPEIKQDWISALLPQEGHQAEIEIEGNGASLRNGSIMAKVNASGELSFVNVDTGNVLLKEQPIHAMSIPARHYKDLKGIFFTSMFASRLMKMNISTGWGSTSMDAWIKKAVSLN